MPTAANGVTLTTTGISGNLAIFDATSGGSENSAGGCATFFVTNRSSNSVNVLINIPGLHNSNEYLGIPPNGVPMSFRNGNSGITKVNAKTDSSTATIDYGVQAKF